MSNMQYVTFFSANAIKKVFLFSKDTSGTLENIGLSPKSKTTEVILHYLAPNLSVCP